MTFPKSARYKRASKLAEQFLVDNNITDFPIDPFEIIERNKWGLITYSELAHISKTPFFQVVRACQSNDGYVMYDEESKNHTIAYNDTIRSKDRIRFTLLHEIGHIYLNHLVDFQETVITRNSLTETKYKILENETNHFARNVLAPTQIINQIETPTESDVSYFFGISLKAAKVRLELLFRDSVLSSWGNSLLEQFGAMVYKLNHIHFCTNCKHEFIKENVVFCPICGKSNKLKKRGYRKMIYDGVSIDENGRAIECPKCGNEQIIKGEYCKICGVHVVNRCDRSYYDHGQLIIECGELAEGNARYCTECGHETTFFKNGILKDWEDELKNGLPF